jgi:hypothetical protein
LVRKIAWEFCDQPLLYTSGWVNKDVNPRSIKQCKIKIYISKNYIDEVEVDIVPLDVCGAIFISLYMYMKDTIFMREEKWYFLIKDGNSFIINAHKDKSNISLVSANQDKKFISSSGKFSSLLLR